jgi:hypothetical protein
MTKAATTHPRLWPTDKAKKGAAQRRRGGGGWSGDGTQLGARGAMTRVDEVRSGYTRARVTERVRLSERGHEALRP